MLKFWLRLLILVCIPMMLISDWGTSAAQDNQQETNAPEYRHLTTIARDVLPFDYNPEYFAFNPDGSQIAAIATDSTVNVWDAETGAVIYILEYEALAVSWSPDGRWIGTSEADRTIHIWDVAIGQLRYALDEAGWYIGWEADSTRFVTNHGRIFDAQTGELLSELGLNWGVPYEVEWSPDGTMIASASGWDGSETLLWSVEGEQLDVFWTMHSISWSPDSTRLASFGQVRDVSTGLPVAVMPEMYGEIGWHPHGEWIASAHDDIVYLWNAETGEQLSSWDLPGCDIRGLTWSGDGNRFAVACFRDTGQSEDCNGCNELIIWERVR